MTTDETEESFQQRLADAHADWEADRALELSEARLQVTAVRTGWIPLPELATATGLDEDAIWSALAPTYRLGRLHSDQWAVRWFDAFEWLQGLFASRWDPTSQSAKDAVTWLQSIGLSEEAASARARRDFISEQASQPLEEFIGIHTHEDRTHLLEGLVSVGLNSEGHAVTSVNDFGWEPRSEAERAAGFPVWVKAANR